MSSSNRAILLVVVQCLLVSSIAAKYLYERATAPRVWVRVAQYDPELPMRGRYLALQPVIDICGLVQNTAPRESSASANFRSYRVHLIARNGKLSAEDAQGHIPLSESQMVLLNHGVGCDRAPVWPGINYFVAENARSPFPLKPGQELWAEVTVPPSGPPRAIQLALSDNGSWQVLKFD